MSPGPGPVNQRGACSIHRVLCRRWVGRRPSIFTSSLLLLPSMVPIPISLNETLGAAFVGDILAACLYGLTTLQTLTYFGRCRKDSVVLKSLVILLWALDTLHLILVSHTVYSYTITNFGNVPALLKPTWSVIAQVFVTGVSDGIVRALYCYRIWMFSGRRWLLTTAIVIGTLATCGSSLAYAARGLQQSTFIELEKFSWLLYFSLSWAFLSDFLIAATMCTLLTKRRNGALRKVDHAIRVLILYSINTGVLTTLCTLMALIAYAVSPHTFIYIGFYFLLPKLMLNSVLGALNARKTIREQMSGGIVSIPLPNITGSTEASTDRMSEGTQNRRFTSALLEHGKAPSSTDCIVKGAASQEFDA
ncbi:hypothetical protein C8Q73DRAFT_687432 [Cubamyces lactineus]|nr:hypothetical protein C8Q73DRAFT_687432 [Cubamyces lactineus]